MYKELEKYIIERDIPVTMPVVETTLNGINQGMTGTIKDFIYYQDEYRIPLGDLLNDIINHKRKPFWRRKYYHKHLTEIYTKILNQFTILYYL